MIGFALVNRTALSVGQVWVSDSVCDLGINANTSAVATADIFLVECSWCQTLKLTPEKKLMPQLMRIQDVHMGMLAFAQLWSVGQLSPKSVAKAVTAVPSLHTLVLPPTGDWAVSLSQTVAPIDTVLCRQGIVNSREVAADRRCNQEDSVRLEPDAACAATSNVTNEADGVKAQHGADTAVKAESGAVADCVADAKDCVKAITAGCVGGSKVTHVWTMRWSLLCDLRVETATRAYIQAGEAVGLLCMQNGVHATCVKAAMKSVGVAATALQEAQDAANAADIGVKAFLVG